MLKKRRNARNDTNGSTHTSTPDMSDWRNVIGRHSIMLALEPRFMFDGTGADAADPTADAGGDVPDPVADSPDGSESGDGDGVTVFNTFGIQTFGNEWEDPDPLGLNVGSSSTSGWTLNEDGAQLIDDITVTGGSDTDYVKVEITLSGGGDSKVDFDFDPNSFQGSGVWGESNIDRTRQDEGVITVWGTQADVNKLLETLTFEAGENFYTSDGATNTPVEMRVTLYSCDSTGQNATLVETIDNPVEITVNEVNDPTTLDVPKIDDVIVTQIVGFEDKPLVINDYLKGLGQDGTAGLVVSDPDDLDRFVTIEFTLSRDWGKLSFDDGNGVWKSESGGTYVFEGTLDEVQAVLDSLVYESPDEKYGTVGLKITVGDDRTVVAERAAANFDIKITEVNDAPTFWETGRTGDFLAMDDVKEGEMVEFTEEMFALKDIDNSDSHLVITINEAPLYGTIMKLVGSAYVPILAGESFTYADVIAGKIVYQHNGEQVRGDTDDWIDGDSFHNTDSFTFSVNDGAGGFLNDAGTGNASTITEGEITKTVHTFKISLKAVNQLPTVSTGDTAETGGVAVEIYEGQEEVVVRFDIADSDQLARNADDYTIIIGNDVGLMDGKLYLMNDSGVLAPVTADQEISYADILEGKLRFSHNGNAGQDGIPEIAVVGKTRDTAFTFTVRDDGGGTGIAGTTADVTLTFTVLSNNDNPEFTNSLVDGGNGTVTTGGQVGVGNPDSPDHWLIELGTAQNQGGFDVSDVDSSAKDITYTIESLPDYGFIWLKLGDGDEARFLNLKVGDSFTQAQIDAGQIHFAANPGDLVETIVETSFSVTVRDGSLTAWSKVVDADGNDVRDPITGELVVQRGNEGAVGSFVKGADGEYVWTPTVVTIPVKYYVKDGGDFNYTPAPEINLGYEGDAATTVKEGQEVTLSNEDLRSYYVDKDGAEITGSHKDAVYEADPATLVYRIEAKLTCGSLWLVTESGEEKQLALYDSFTQEDLDKGRIVYQHDGSENFTDTLVLTLTDGSINLMEDDSTTVIKQLELTIDVIPGNDTPEITTNDLSVTEGAEDHQDNEVGFDRNGSVIGAGNIVIRDPDGHGDASKAGSDYLSSGDDITIIFQKPEYGDIWVWKGQTADLASANAILDANPGMSLAEYNAKHGATYGEWELADYASSDAYGDGEAVTYALLTAGGVRYVHDGRDPGFEPGDGDYRGGSLSDTVEFRVYDGKKFDTAGGQDHHHQSFSEGTLSVVIANVNDKPRDMGGADPFTTPENGNRDPRYTDKDNIANNDTGSKITPDHLNYVDAERDAASLQYYIDVAPVNGTLYLHTFDAAANAYVWKAIGEGAKFTQKDVNDGNVKYVHNGTETHSDSFTWTLRDGDENAAKWVAGQVFEINVEPTNNAPEIAVDKNAAKTDPNDRYIYITPDDIDGKNLGGVFQISDRDYTDPAGVDKGIAEDMMEATLKSVLASNESTPLGSLFIKAGAGDVAALGGLEISVVASDGAVTTYASILNYLADGCPAGKEIVLTGALDKINAALDLLHYKADTGTGNDDKAVNVVLEVNDLANGDVGADKVNFGHDKKAAALMYANIDNKAPEPIYALPGDGDLVTTEDSAGILIQTKDGNQLLVDLGFVDPDEMNDGDGTWTRNELTFTVPNGSLTFGDVSGVNVTVKGDAYILTGSIAGINKALAGLTYTPDADYNGTEEISVKFDDKVSSSATDGVYEDSFTITVTARNDDPTIDGTDETIVVKGNSENLVGDLLGIVIGDAKDTAGPVGGLLDPSDLELTVTLTVTQEDGSACTDGTVLKLDGAGFDGLVVGTGSNTIVITGKEADITALLEKLHFDTPKNDGVYRIDVEVNDDQNGGSPGDLGIATGSFVIVVATGDTTPEVASPDAIVNEDRPTVVPGIKVESKYPPSALLEDWMQVDLALVGYNTTNPGSGSLSFDTTDMIGVTVKTLANGNTIVDFGGGTQAFITSGGKTISVVGSQAGVNTALEKLTYLSATHANNSSTPVDTITITVTDKPNYTGLNDDMIATASVDITVDAVNDAPTATEPGVAFDENGIEEDVSDGFESDGITYANPGQTVAGLFEEAFSDAKDTVTGGSAANGLAGVVVVGNAATAAQGTWQYFDPNTDSWENIVVPAGQERGVYLGADVLIRFQPAGNYNGTPGKLTVILVDDSAHDAANNPQTDPLPGQDASGTNLPGIHNDDLGYYIDINYDYSPRPDSAAGNANTSRYSDGTVTLTITVNPVNDAPVVGSGDAIDLNAYEDRDTLTGKIGEGLIIPAGTYFDDSKDSGAADTMAGVVVNSVPASQEYGTWEYNHPDNGWTTMEPGVFLAVGTDIRFNPTKGGDPHYNATTVASSITVRLVETDDADDSEVYVTGKTLDPKVNGGDTRISAGTITINAKILPVNDAPQVDADGSDSGDTIGDATITLPALTEGANAGGGNKVEDLFKDYFVDSIDDVPGGSNANSLAGILVIGNEATADQGEWQCLFNGTWRNIDDLVTDGKYLYLSSDAQIRFQPAEDFNGDAPKLEVRLVDDSSDSSTNPANPDLPSLLSLGANGGYAQIAKADFASGGTTRYSAETVTLTQSVTAVNDAPVAGGPGKDVTVAEDDWDNDGVSVEDVFKDAFNDDKDAQTENGGASTANDFAGVIIKTVNDSTHGVWEYEVSDGVWASLADAVVNAGANNGLFLTKDTQIRFSPQDSNGDPDHFNGDPSASIVAYLVETKTDDTDTSFTTNGAVSIAASATGGATRVSSGTVTAKAAITPVNDAPTLSHTTDVYVNAYEDLEGAGYKVGGAATELLFGYFSDATDTSQNGGGDTLLGVIVTGVVNNNGTWEYSDDNGATWKTIPASGTDAGVFIAVGDHIRFNPTVGGTEHFNGDPSASLTVHLVEGDDNKDAPADGNDYTTGEPVSVAKTGDTSRISAGTIVFKARVLPINDAPLVNNPGNGTVTMGTIGEDVADGKDGGVYVNPGYTIEGVFGSHFTDTNDAKGDTSANGFAGVLVVGNAADASTQGTWQYLDESGDWQDIATQDGTDNYLYLAKNAQIRFQPVADFNGDAPELEVRLVDNSAHDATNNPANPALPVLTGGKTYATYPNSDGAPLAVGDTTRFSDGTIKATVKVTAVNDAPVAGGSGEDVTVVEDDRDNNGVSVGSVFANNNNFSDAKDAQTGNGGASSSNDFAGVIIATATDGTHGVWEYYNGSAWVSINDALASANTGEALYLSSATQIRFSPQDANGDPDHFNGDPKASLEAYLVETKTDPNDTAFAATGLVTFDSTTDKGGATRVSSGTVTANAVVTPVNDAPVRDGTGTITELDMDMTEGGLGDPYYEGLVSDIFGDKLNDAKDNQHAVGNADGSKSNTFDGIIVTATNNASNGVWQYRDGGDWVDIAVSGGNGLYLAADTDIRFVPNTATFDYHTSDATASLTVRLVETVTGDPNGAYAHKQIVSSAVLNDASGTAPHSNADNQVVLTFDVSKDNQAPILGGIVDESGDEQTPIHLAPNGTIGDAELDKLDNWNGATLTVKRSDAAPSAADVFGVTGVSVTLSGGAVRVDGVDVGSYSSADGFLSMTFNPNADSDAVKAVLNSLTYTYNGDHPPESDITIEYIVNDGNTGTQGSVLQRNTTFTQTVTVNPVADPCAPNNDSNHVSIDYATQPTCTGNVLANDTHPDIQRNFDPTADLVVLEVDGATIGPGKTAITGQYGTLTIEPDGTYRYVADDTHPDVAALAPGDTLTETFTYTAKDANYAGTNMNGTANLIITISPTGRVPDVDSPNDTGESKAPDFGGESGTELQGLRDPDVDKPVVSTVNNAAESANASLHQSITGLGNHLHLSPLPMSIDADKALFHSSWALDEPMLFGNADEKNARIEEEHEFGLPGNLFVHTRSGERLSYEATLADGSALPEWLVFDPDAFSLFCTPPREAEGLLEVIIRAEDRYGLKAQATVTIKIGDHQEDNPDALAENQNETDDETTGEETTDAEETPADEALAFAGEWLLLETNAADTPAAPGIHPGLSNQIAATGSSRLTSDARELLNALAGVE